MPTGQHGKLNLQVRYRVNTDVGEASLRAQLAADEKGLGAEHVQTLISTMQLAGLLGRHGKYEESQHMYEGLAVRYKRVFGPSHPDTIHVVRSMLTHQGEQAFWLNDKDQFSEAEEIFRPLIPRLSAEPALGPRHHITQVTLNNLIECLKCQGKFAEAEAEARKLLEVCSRACPHSCVKLQQRCMHMHYKQSSRMRVATPKGCVGAVLLDSLWCVWGVWIATCTPVIAGRACATNEHAHQFGFWLTLPVCARRSGNRIWGTSILGRFTPEGQYCTQPQQPTHVRRVPWPTRHLHRIAFS